jgi:hypothetical protein
MKFFSLLLIFGLMGGGIKTSDASECNEELHPAFAPWIFGVDPLPFAKPDDLLPPEYLQRVRSISVRMYITHDVNHFRFVAFNRNGGVGGMEFSILPGTAENSVKIENLQVQDFFEGSPLEKVRKVRPKQKKLKHGLPADVYRYVQNRIISALQATSKIEYIQTTTFADYLVNLLYRRTGHLLPQTKFGEELYQSLDSFYRVVSIDLPDPYRVKNLDAYSKLIGSYSRSPGRQLQAPVDDYLQNKVPGTVTETIKAKGQIVGMNIHFADDEQQFYLLMPIEGKLQLLTFSNLLKLYPVDLQLWRNIRN